MAQVILFTTFDVPRPLRSIQREAKKNVAGVRILGIGEVDRLSCLGIGSLTELSLKPETLNPKT